MITISSGIFCFQVPGFIGETERILYISVVKIGCIMYSDHEYRINPNEVFNRIHTRFIIVNKLQINEAEVSFGFVDEVEILKKNIAYLDYKDAKLLQST